MLVLTNEQMRRLDRISIEREGISSLKLMENAAKAVADFILERFPPKRRVFVLCGPGNNGGDGMALVRLLKKKGYGARALLFFSENSLRGDPLTQFQKLPKNSYFFIKSISQLRDHGLRGKDILVDALFGTGLTRPVSGLFKQAIDWMNDQSVPRISIDIPSGLHGDSGDGLGAAVNADVTVTLGFPKKGFFFSDGPKHVGDLVVSPIGLSNQAIEELQQEWRKAPSKEIKIHLITKSCFTELLKPRPRQAHKGTFGHVFTIAGSKGKIGAGVMAAFAALKAGAGLSTLVLPESAYEKIDPKALEIMYEPLPDGGAGYFRKDQAGHALSLIQQRAAAVAIGPGLGTDEETRAFVLEVIRYFRGPLVIDADGLNILVDGIGTLKQRTGLTILTPHPGEMARLAGLSTKEVLKNRLEVAHDFAVQNDIVLLLKGYRSLIAFPDGNVWINPTGNAAMGSAGQGDTLTGLITAFLSQFPHHYEAILFGPFLHGLVGDVLARKGSRVVLATEIANHLALGYGSLKKKSPFLELEFSA